MKPLAYQQMIGGENDWVKWREKDMNVVYLYACFTDTQEKSSSSGGNQRNKIRNKKRKKLRMPTKWIARWPNLKDHSECFFHVSLCC